MNLNKGTKDHISNSRSNLIGITRYKTRFSYVVKTINYVEEDRLASMKYSR
jgi:hypothetical protein